MPLRVALRVHYSPRNRRAQLCFHQPSKHLSSDPKASLCSLKSLRVKSLSESFCLPSSLLQNPRTLSVQFHSLGASHKSPLCIMVLHRTKFLVYLIWMTTVVFVKYKFFKRLLSIYSYYKIPELQNIPQTSLSPSYIQQFVPLFPHSVLPFPPLPTVTLVCSQYL